MTKNIWQSLKAPIFILAPMEDVTDTVFRRIISSAGRPDLYFSEFTSCEGMLSVGQKHVVHRLQYDKEERPIIAQIWGIHPDAFYEASKQIKKLGFDGIDINMGCPVKSVIKQGACSALIKNHRLAAQIIQATKDGGRLPVSVKTRLGFEDIQTEEWVSFLLEQDIDALTIHARTVKELSKVAPHWDEVRKAVEIRNQMKIDTKIIGNGDIISREEGLEKIRKTGSDGVMIGRGIFHNPWLFNPKVDSGEVSVNMRLELLKKHAVLFSQTWKEQKKFQVLKKYIKIYVSDFDGASDLRKELMETVSTEEMCEIVNKYQDKFGG